jgi:hypothetical protein
VSRKKDRFRLLLYARMIGRQRLPALMLALIFLGLWYGVTYRSLEWPDPAIANLLLTGGVLSLAFWVFTIFAPRQAYAQARKDHLRLQSPVFRLKVRYMQILNTRPVKMGRVFPPNSISAGERRALSPFYGNTALAIDLNDSPRFLFLLRLFFPRLTLNPEAPGLILLVDDWISLSQQLSSRIDAWRMTQPIHVQDQVSGAAQIIQESKEEKKSRFKFFKGGE